MKEQVLTIEQMQELEILGIDISKASMCWVDDRTSVILDCHYQSYTEEDKLYLNITPTFTLQNILDLLPASIPEKASDGYKDGESLLKFNKTEIWYESWHLDDHHIHTEGRSSLLINAFEMLKWCKQNNYI